MVDRDSGRLTGAITVLAFRDAVAEIGYWTAPEARGAGRTAQALRLVTGWCFTERGCARVELSTDVDNIGSRRVAESAGFVLDGILRQRTVVKGRRIDSALYSRLPADPARTDPTLPRPTQYITVRPRHCARRRAPGTAGHGE